MSLRTSIEKFLVLKELENLLYLLWCLEVFTKKLEKENFSFSFIDIF